MSQSGRGACGRCGNSCMVRNFVSLCCPICGERVQLSDDGAGALWAEHRLGLLFQPGGWRFMDVVEPPGWFLENVA